MKREIDTKRVRPRAWRTLLIILAVVGAIYYGLSIMGQDEAEVNSNNKGHALAETAQLAFGQTSYLSNYAKFIVAPKILAECKVKNPSAGVSCSLVTAGSTQFYSYCRWWRFEKCSHVSVDPLFLRYPALKEQLDQILHDPCSFIPPETAIKKSIAPEESKALGQPSAVRSYTNYRQDLECDQRLKSPLKVIVAFPDAGESKIEIIKTK